MNEEDDVIRLNVALFLRLLELAREDIKDDLSLHFVTEKVTELSQTDVVTMDDYNEIIDYMKSKTKTNELDDIRRLGGF